MVKAVLFCQRLEHGLSKDGNGFNGFVQGARCISQAKAADKCFPLDLLCFVSGKAITERYRVQRYGCLPPVECLTNRLGKNRAIKVKVRSQRPNVVKVLHPAVHLCQIHHPLNLLSNHALTGIPLQCRCR